MSGITRRAAVAGSLAALLAAGCGRAGGRRRGRASIEGRFVDDGVRAGHMFRDGRLQQGGSPLGAIRKRVVVVGGGVAGLSAAWRLARAGVEDVVLLELGKGVGGTSRGGTLRSPDGHEHPCPFGAHYLPVPRPEQAALVAFLRDAGVATGLRLDGSLEIPDRLLVRDPAERIAGLGFFEEGLWLHAGATASDHADLERFEAEVERRVGLGADGRRLFDLPVERSSVDARALDRTSAAAWCDELGLTAPRIRWYLQYATRDDFGATLEQTSAWALLHYFTARANLLSKESAPFMTWADGNAHLVRALVRSMAGVEIRTGDVALSVEPRKGGATVESIRMERGERTRWDADAVVLATPQYVTRRLLRDDPASGDRALLRYGPWIVANLHLAERPASRGFPDAWDSVLHGSPSLGYVDATHQLDRADARDTVWTWYLPVVDDDEAAARTRLLETPWEEVRDAILADLRVAHPDIDDLVTRIDVWRWGHGMVKPTPGTMWGGVRERVARPVGRVHLAHSDLSGMALFEEAHWQGTRAAEAVLAQLGVAHEPLAS
ncbi:MAG: FAD-dependent oxidoreductase [Planctomycetota bacterium]